MKTQTAANECDTCGELTNAAPHYLFGDIMCDECMCEQEEDCSADGPATVREQWNAARGLK